MFIKRVNSLIEFRHLMKKIETETPDVRWVEGQKPTLWEPESRSFPRNIYLREEGNKKIIACWE